MNVYWAFFLQWSKKYHKSSIWLVGNITSQTTAQLRMRSGRHIHERWRLVSRADGKYIYIIKHTHMHPSTSSFDLSHSHSWLSLLNSSKVWQCTVSCFFLEWVNCAGRGWLISLLRAADGQWDAQRSSQCERLPFRSSFLNGIGHTSHNTLVQPSAARRLEPTKHIGCFCVPCLKKPQCSKHNITPPAGTYHNEAAVRLPAASQAHCSLLHWSLVVWKKMVLAAFSAHSRVRGHG